MKNVQSQFVLSKKARQKLKFFVPENDDNFCQLRWEAIFLVCSKKLFLKEVMGKQDKPPSKAKKAAKNTAKATSSSGKASSSKKSAKTVKAGMEKIQEFWSKIFMKINPCGESDELIVHLNFA